MHTTATDVDSAALVLFQLFSGQHPFGLKVSANAGPKEIAAMVRESRNQTIPNITGLCDRLDKRWNDFFRTALARDFEDRPPSAKELLHQYVSLSVPAAPREDPEPDLDSMISEAKRLALQTETLEAAVELLENACRLSPPTRSKYSDMLLLWKRGIVL
jgi:serine/threonine protein kinase